MKNKYIPIIILISVGLLILILYTPPVSDLFGVSTLSLNELLLPLVIAFASTFWIDIFKYVKNW